MTRLRAFSKILDVNKELWLLLSMFMIAAAINFVVASHRVLLGFYGLPTLFSAYHYGRRHAVLTGLASILMVFLILLFNPVVLQEHTNPLQKWVDLAIWAGILLITAYGMGTLYELKTKQYGELRETYDGVLMILCHFVSKDNYTQNHSYRVSVYATQLAQELGASPEFVEDVRAAGLLHDIGKLDVSRQVLYKSAQLTPNESQEMARHASMGGELVDMARGSLRRVVPLILAHHDRFDGRGEFNQEPGTIFPWARASSPLPMSTTPSPVTAPTARPCLRTRFVIISSTAQEPTSIRRSSMHSPGHLAGAFSKCRSYWYRHKSGACRGPGNCTASKLESPGRSGPAPIGSLST